MKPDELKEWIDSLSSDIEFQYRGVWGSICPFSRENISVSYGKKERTFSSIEDVMNTSFIDGKAIKDVCEKFTFA